MGEAQNEVVVAAAQRGGGIVQETPIDDGGENSNMGLLFFSVCMQSEARLYSCLDGGARGGGESFGASYLAEFHGDVVQLGRV